MNNHPQFISSFNLRSLAAAAIPSYVFPTVMSFLSGYFLHKSELMSASYTTIGISSLVSTVLSFLLLWQFELKQILVNNKLIRSLLIIGLMVSLGAFFTTILNLPSEAFNIVFSAFLGAAIITIRQKVNNYRDEKN